MVLVFSLAHLLITWMVDALCCKFPVEFVVSMPHGAGPTRTLRDILTLRGVGNLV